MSDNFENKPVGSLKSAECMLRHPINPILSKKHIPYQAELISNAGVAKYQGRYVMVFKNQFPVTPDEKWPSGVNLGLAFSMDGVAWEVEPEPWYSLHDDEVNAVYDPRITILEGRCYLTLAVETRHGLQCGIALTEDFETPEFIQLSLPDNRNSVLFPEKIGGSYFRLDRPFPMYSRGNSEIFDTWISASPDLIYWGKHRLLLPVEKVPFANMKTGPGAPPVKTSKGWLTTFHAVDFDPSRGKNGWEDKWQKRYTAGIMLLDIDDPGKIKGICPTPLLTPEAAYETEDGFRNNVIFPTGMILEDSGEVKIYYGAADAHFCLATADVGDLLKLCGA